jgi:site-specific DNA-methyltransferase (adenine-specific)
MTAQLDLFKTNSTQTIILCDCLDEMKKMADNSIDFIVTDPPYGLNFMNKKWDDKVPNIDIWSETLRICKPGSMLAAFGGSRTHHHLMIALERAGWEIRDVVFWLHGQGFPKSHNHFGLEGYGTALKPAYEPIIIAMKPLDGTYAKNAEKWGVAGINIDSSRISTNENITNHSRSSESSISKGIYGDSQGQETHKTEGQKLGRWPSNLVLDEESAEMLDQQSGNNASRFLYCPKASPSERNKGLEGLPIKETHRYGSGIGEGKHPELPSKGQNTHPTVKPISLMKYIIKLLAPPGNPTLLDPFAGSGTTILSAKELGINAIGIEKEQEYYEIAKARIENG